ncbi:MAG: DUF5655 domain-containing protein [Patescibacteria group bacterium]
MNETGLGKIQADSVSAEIYEVLLKTLKKIGPFEVEVKKTSLHITHGRAFLGIHPRKAGLLLNIVTNQSVDDPRIKKVEQVSANRYHNEIVLGSPEELDGSLIEYIRQAYALTKDR